MTTVPPALNPPRTANLPVFATALAAWRMVVRFVADMPVPVTITFALFIGHELLAPRTAGIDSADSVPAVLFSAMINALIGAPLTIAVFRYALLHEIPAAPARSLFRPTILRFGAFVTVSVTLSILLALLFTLPSLASGNEAFTGAAYVLTIVASAFIIVRATLYFPALAVDAPDATFANAWGDSLGYFWKILLVNGCVLLPVLVVAALFGESATASDGGTPGPSPLNAILGAAVSTCLVVCSAAQDSYVFVALSNRLGRPANVVLVPAS